MDAVHERRVIAHFQGEGPKKVADTLTVVAKKGRTLYDTAWERQVFPSAVWRWSTRDFKITPILRHYRSLGGHVNQYLAIAWDEVMRMKDSRVEYVTNLYPLIDRRITRAGCLELIQSEGLPIPPRSAYYFCPFNSVERWRWLFENHPELYEKAIALADIFRRGEQLPAVPVKDQQPCGAERLT